MADRKVYQAHNWDYFSMGMKTNKRKRIQLKDILEDFAIATRTELLHGEGINKTGCLNAAALKIEKIYDVQK